MQHYISEVAFPDYAEYGYIILRLFFQIMQNMDI